MASMSIDLNWILPASFSLVTAVIAFLIRSLLRAYNEKAKLELDKAKLEVAALRTEVDTRLRSLVDNFDRLDRGLGKLQEVWSDFQRNTTAVETIRHKRIDAMFTVLDKLREEFRTIKTVVLKKQKELHNQSLDELRNYVHKIAGEAVQNEFRNLRANGDSSIPRVESTNP